MSLNFDLTNVQHRDESEAGWRRTESIIWGCMAVGMQRIGEDGATCKQGPQDAKEYWTRILILRKLGGWGPLLTWLDVVNHVGVSTNVTQESRKQWLKRMTDGLEREQGFQAVRDALQLEARKELLIMGGDFAPAAREMAWPVLEHQFREANALSFEEARAEILSK